MMKLLQHIEDMRSRLDEIGSEEQALVKALGEALNRLDDQLLRDVRTIATQHEVRRETIFSELQELAAGIGMFQGLLYGSPAREELPSYAPSHGDRQAIAPGDWRQATSNIEDDLSYHMNGNGRTSSH